MEGSSIIEDVKILVVEDDSTVRNLTVTALTYCLNRKVLSFIDGRYAWEFIEDGGEVDIIISDVDMPQMNGIDLMTRVRDKYPDKKFIIMSGVRENEDKSRRAGADAFLAKPFEINDLFNIVQDFVVE